MLFSAFSLLLALLPSIGIRPFSQTSDRVIVVRGVEAHGQEEGDRITIPLVNHESGGMPRRLPGVRRPEPEAKSALVIHKPSGAILYAKNRDVVRPIASLTKLMTAFVVTERIQDQEREVTVTRVDDAKSGRLFVSPGERLSVKDLLYMSLVASANDATLALSRASGLTRQEFVRVMNARARALGLNHTRFTDPTGLAASNVSTATEIARLLSVVLEQSLLRQALHTKEYQYATLDEARKGIVTTTNKLLGKSSMAVLGGKTGYIDESGYNLAVEARGRNGEDFIVVILGAPRENDRFSEAEELVRWAEKAWNFSH